MKVLVPKEIRVGGHTFTILFQTDESARGRTNVRRLRITVCRDMAASQTNESFIHELLHAIDDVYGGEEEVTEGGIRALSHGLWQILSDNGVEFDWSEIT